MSLKKTGPGTRRLFLMISALCAVAAVLALWLIRPWGGAEAVLIRSAPGGGARLHGAGKHPFGGGMAKKGGRGRHHLPRTAAGSPLRVMTNWFICMTWPAGKNGNSRFPKAMERFWRFPGDARLLFAGECSVDGTLYAIDVDTGKKKMDLFRGPRTWGVRPKTGPLPTRPWTSAAFTPWPRRKPPCSPPAPIGDRRLIRNPGRPTLVKDVLDTVVYAFDPGTGKKAVALPGRRDHGQPHALSGVFQVA